MEKVIVGMSGGVDSAVAAYLLKERGFDVTGVTLRILENESRCCEIEDARDAAKTLGIGYRVINCSPRFKERIVAPFIKSYAAGETPSPCPSCNRFVKWDYLIYAADVAGARYVATGHYAKVVRTESGRYTVAPPYDSGKDQCYMLSFLTQSQLSRTLFPLGDFTKDEVRRIASRFAETVSSKPDSEEICFAPPDGYAALLQNEVGPAGGNIVTPRGEILGRHDGYYKYTVGQRRGLGLALPESHYVKRIDAATRDVVIVPERELYEKTVVCGDVNYMAAESFSPGERVFVKIRYRDRGAWGSVTPQGDRLRVDFDMSVRAPAPGQIAVFYDERGFVLAAGVIRKGC